MNNIYEKLCQITIGNLQHYNSEMKIHFERPEGLCYSIFNYPVKVLLEIEGTEDFIRECFYKILDRVVDEKNLNKYLNEISSERMTREGFIKEIYQSNERAIKMTGLSE